jgi:hypothetical protein
MVLGLESTEAFVMSIMPDHLGVLRCQKRDWAARNSKVQDFSPVVS